MAAQVTPASVCTGLASYAIPNPSIAWLTSIITGQRPTTPLAAIVATARHRLLAADLTTPALLDATTSALPSNLSNPSTQSSKLQHDTPVQVLSVEDLSKSRWEQLESILAVERGELVRGREVIRLLPEDGEENNISPNPGVTRLAPASSGLTRGSHKLVLQDWKGEVVFGVEVKSIQKVGLGMDIGLKMVLRKGCEVARGMVMLEPSSVIVLGGKIDSLHKAWQANRKIELNEALEATSLEYE